MIRLYLGITPKRTLILASPRSASNNNTFLPVDASAMARFTETEVFPTPALAAGDAENIGAESTDLRVSAARADL